MYSESVSTLSFMARDQQCILPIFQRPYTWERNNQCKTLFEDVKDIGENEKCSSCKEEKGRKKECYSCKSFNDRRGSKGKGG